MGGRALFKEGLEGGSTFRCASSGGICTGSVGVALDVCFGLSLTSLPREVGRCASETLLAGGAVADFLGGSLGATVLIDGLTVEFDDEVDDSRTGGRPSREESALPEERLGPGGLAFRVGLCCRSREVVPDVTVTTAGEYEEHELGVGA
jgi:hypothetical protein